MFFSFEEFALDQIEHSILLIQNDVIKFANKHFEKIIGIQRNYLIGKDSYDFFSLENKKKFIETIQQCKSMNYSSNNIQPICEYFEVLPKNISDSFYMRVLFYKYDNSRICCFFRNLSKLHQRKRLNWFEVKFFIFF